MPEVFQEPHEPPHVLAAVAEEIAVELGLGCRRQLRLMEQQPLELETRRLTVADHQGVIEAPRNASAACPAQSRGQARLTRRGPAKRSSPAQRPAT